MRRAKLLLLLLTGGSWLGTAQQPRIDFSTTLGAYGSTGANAVALDAGGNLFVAGYTEASDYPVQGLGRAHAGGVDAVVTRIAPGGHGIVWSTHAGGRAEDRALAVAPDGAGGVYLAGFTTSSDFPAARAAEGALRGIRDAFVQRLDAAGNVVFSTYLGGTGTETAYALAADAQGVWVAGVTDSVDFPVLNAYQPARKGRQDGFFARFTSAGVLVSASYAGGSGDDLVRAIQLLAGGEVVLAGGTDSPDWVFGPGAYQKALNGLQDGFIVKLDAAGRELLGGTYLGGSGGSWSSQETVMAMAGDPNGSIWAGGATPSQDFPRVSAWQKSYTDLQDGYLVQFDAGLVGIQQAAVLGGSQRDGVAALAAAANGDLLAGGFTTSPDFPMLSPLQPACGRSRDGFVLRWTNGATAPAFSTCLGGLGGDGVLGLAINDSGLMAAAGQTDSNDFPVKSPLQIAAGSSPKLFAALISAAAPATATLRVETPSPVNGQGNAGLFSFSATHSGGGQAIRTLTLAISPAASLANACAVRYNAESGTFMLADAAGVFTQTVRPGVAEQAQNENCILYGVGSSASVSGGTLRATASLLLLAAFGGEKKMLAGAQAEVDIDPVEQGAWTVLSTNAAPAVIAVQTPGAAGSGGVFEIALSDPQGASDLGTSFLLINKTQHSVGACNVAIDAQTGTVSLGDDLLLNWSPLKLGEPRTVENSRCALHGGSSGSAISGGTAVFRLSLSLKSPMLGLNRVWVEARDRAGLSSGNVQAATFTIIESSEFPNLGSVAAMSSEGAAEVFSFSASHAKGAGLISELIFALSPGTTLGGACSVRYLPASGVLQLAGSDGVFGTAVRPGSADSAANAMCSLHGPGSRVETTASEVKVKAGLLFSQSFSGPRNLLLGAKTADKATPLERRGEWRVVSGNSPPAIFDVSLPLSPGAGGMFEFIMADRSADEISNLFVLINQDFNAGRACMFMTDRQWNAIYLWGDNGLEYSAAFLGDQVTLENSQCQINAQLSKQLSIDPLLTHRISIRFKEAFAGVKKVWAAAQDRHGAYSKWTPGVSYTVQ